LKDKEIMAHLMMREDLASEIDKYKFVINPDIYTLLVYKKLISMDYAQGWKWKKKIAPKYDKLVMDWIPIEAERLGLSSYYLLANYGEIYNDMSVDESFKLSMIKDLISYNKVRNQKDITKLYKKYNVKEEQTTLW